jgi:hypothetical protein
LTGQLSVIAREYWNIGLVFDVSLFYSDEMVDFLFE